MTPPTHPGGPGGQQDQGHWVNLSTTHIFMSGGSIYECLIGVPIQYFGLDPIDPGLCS